MHQRRALGVTARPERPGLDRDAGIGENFGSEVGRAMKFAPVIGQIFQEYRNIGLYAPYRDGAGPGPTPRGRID